MSFVGVEDRLQRDMIWVHKGYFFSSRYEMCCSEGILIFRS